MLVWLVLVCSCFEEPLVQAQQAARTDPVEAAALNTILGRWGKKAMPSPAWNISGDPCSGAAVDGNNGFKPGITCACSSGDNGSVCHITMLKVYALDVVGQIPSELQNLTYLTYLNLDLNYLTGPIPSFIGQFSAMQHFAWGLYEGKQPLRISDPRIEEFDAEEALRAIRIALICTQGSPHQRPPMSRVVAMLTGKAEVAEEIARPSYVIEWQFRGGSSSGTTSRYWGSTTPEFSRQKEVDPLTQSPTITGASHEIEGR